MRFARYACFVLCLVSLTLLVTFSDRSVRAALPKCQSCDCVEAVVFKHHNSGVCEGAREKAGKGVGNPVSTAMVAWAKDCSTGQVTADHEVELAWCSYGQNCTAVCAGLVDNGAWIVSTINEDPTISILAYVSDTYCED